MTYRDRKRFPYSANRTINTACIELISEHRTWADAVRACLAYHEAHPEQTITEIYGPGTHSIGAAHYWREMLAFLAEHPEFEEQPK